MDSIPERDWKVLRSLHDVTLDRLCTRILDEARSILDNREKSSHERYLELFKHFPKRDRDLQFAFDGMSRSSAMMRILFMKRIGLFTDSEYERFSEETRDWVKRAMEITLARPRNARKER